MKRRWSEAGTNVMRHLWRRLCDGARKKVQPRCGALECVYARGVWRRIRHRRASVRIQGTQYCMPECFEQALVQGLRRARAQTPFKPAPHRIPLGLLLLSRQQLSSAQLNAGLLAQAHAGRGKIGEWLQELGFVGEPQITAALARQWSCPIWQTNSRSLTPVSFPEIPRMLLYAVRMMPVSFISATATLHVAFADRIDYAALYAIEQMLDCRTQPCVVGETLLHNSLLALSEMRSSQELIFDRIANTSEIVRIVSNYAIRVAASEIRLAACREHSWIRLECAPSPPLNLLLRLPTDPLAEVG